MGRPGLVQHVSGDLVKLLHDAWRWGASALAKLSVQNHMVVGEVFLHRGFGRRLADPASRSAAASVLIRPQRVEATRRNLIPKRKDQGTLALLFLFQNQPL